MIFSDADRGDPEADARLMAAAPLLLDVLQDLEWIWEESEQGFCCPVCGHRHELEHVDDCELAAALVAARGDQR
jgi:hypothetical protein